MVHDLTLARPDEFDMEWERCAPYLLPALARDPIHTMDEVRDLCREHPHVFQFWPGVSSAAVTQIVSQPHFREAHIWLAGGDLEELDRGLASVEAFARASHCKRVTVWGRRGFARHLKTRGYDLQFVSLAKDLSQ